MSRSLPSLRRGLLGIAFAGTLGFGVTQAFGAPSSPAPRAYCSSLAEIRYCNRNCIDQGFKGGTCDPELGCICNSIYG